MILLGGCGGEETAGAGEEIASSEENRTITPISLPDPGVKGFSFPEQREEVKDWVENGRRDKMFAHSWGLWTALTMRAGEKYHDQELRTFETWYTPDHIQKCLKREESCLEEGALSSVDGRGTLGVPHQFVHSTPGLRGGKGDSVVTGFVKYNPASTKHTLEHGLYLRSTLEELWTEGKKDVPDFPNSSITIKPVFREVRDRLVQNGYYKLPSWPGPPENPNGHGYKPTDWDNCVNVFVSEGEKRGTKPCDGPVFDLDDFIHYRVSDEQEAHYAILVAMHVTTKELKRWTWQTYWWTPTPDTPNPPSSAFIASARPEQLTGAPRHYAMSVAYSMIRPPQPYTGGSIRGRPIYAYNPYLEAEFDSTKFQHPASVKVGAADTLTNNSGVRTNCMSCHGHANVAMKQLQDTTGYVADTYVDMEGKAFEGSMKLDFLWSIQGNLIPPDSVQSE